VDHEPEIWRLARGMFPGRRACSIPRTTPGVPNDPVGPAQTTSRRTQLIVNLAFAKQFLDYRQRRLRRSHEPSAPRWHGWTPQCVLVAGVGRPPRRARTSWTTWGSFGWFGPFDGPSRPVERGIARALLDVNDGTVRRTTDEGRGGSTTFASSPKHVALLPTLRVLAAPADRRVDAARPKQRPSRIGVFRRSLRRSSSQTLRAIAAINERAASPASTSAVEIVPMVQAHLGDVVIVDNTHGGVGGFAVVHPRRGQRSRQRRRFG